MSTDHSESGESFELVPNPAEFEWTKMSRSLSFSSQDSSWSNVEKEGKSQSTEDDSNSTHSRSTTTEEKKDVERSKTRITDQMGVLTIEHQEKIGCRAEDNLRWSSQTPREVAGHCHHDICPTDENSFIPREDLKLAPHTNSATEKTRVPAGDRDLVMPPGTINAGIEDDLVSALDEASVSDDQTQPSFFEASIRVYVDEQELDRSQDSIVFKRLKTNDDCRAQYLLNPQECLESSIMSDRKPPAIFGTPPRTDAKGNLKHKLGWGSCTSPLSASFQPPHHLSHEEGGFEGAIKTAREQKRLLLVSIQDYREFGSHAVNRDIFGDDLVQQLIQNKFVFWQRSFNNWCATKYAKKFQVRKFPHIAIVHPNHEAIIWGFDGWTSEMPWTISEVVEKMTDICFERYNNLQLGMDIEYPPHDEENIYDCSADNFANMYGTQQAMLDEQEEASPSDIDELFATQAALLGS